MHDKAPGLLVGITAAGLLPIHVTYRKVAIRQPVGGGVMGGGGD